MLFHDLRLIVSANRTRKAAKFDNLPQGTAANVSVKVAAAPLVRMIVRLHTFLASFKVSVENAGRSS
jgi:hypothetical protein